MQEVTLTIHDICNGDIPPKEGYYLMVTGTSEGKAELMSMYWRENSHSWTTNSRSDTLFLPQSYWGHLWAEDTVTGKVKF